MPQIGYDPATGRLTLDGQVLERNDPRMYGSLGHLADRGGHAANQIDIGATLPGNAGFIDPDLYEPYTVWTENGEVTRYRLKPEVEQELGGRTQLSQSGVGGWAEVIDPSQLEWDDKWGILTPAGNIKETDPGGFLQRNPWVLMLPAAWGALSAGGAFGGAEAGAANLAPGGPSGTAAFGTPGFGAGPAADFAGIMPGSGAAPAAFGSPGFGAGEAFFGADTLGLGGGGGALGTGTSLVGTGLGAGTLTGPLGSGFSLAGTGLAPGVVTGTGAVAGGAAGGSLIRDALSLARDLLGGGGAAPGGMGILGGFGAAPKIGEHRQDNDPYGLMASGFGPWTGLIPEDPEAKKAKITEAMMKRQQGLA